ncbi:hypothetical protein [Frankia sp. AgB32]|uniref:hypothetical protein n=1 Tax=Frankia sp. AgB32 TaxID=631119 RepID=UPI002010C28A|nr:hypothetical protein [Frankia sp. AgB32]MCK9893508.1 hypothetical protein [Frankia sp. AgB32]
MSVQQLVDGLGHLIDGGLVRNDAAFPVDDGGTEVMAPTRLERWPTIVPFFTDPDGYLVEVVQRLP